MTLLGSVDMEYLTLSINFCFRLHRMSRLNKTSGGANLNFWLNVTTSEAAGASVFDRLFIEVRNTSGTLLGTLTTFSNQNSGTAGVYVLRGAYNLSAWAGQTGRVQFRSTQDVTLPT